MVNNPKCYLCYHHYHHHKHQEYQLGNIDQELMSKTDLKFPKSAKLKLFCLLCFCFFSFSLIWLTLMSGLPFSSSCTFLAELPSGAENSVHEKVLSSPTTPSVSNETMYCDRSHFRTDVCFMKGDIRTHFSSSSIFLYTSRSSKDSIDPLPQSSSQQENGEQGELQHEIIRPYTRKWETSIMNTIDQLHLISKYNNSNSNHHCDVVHDVPAVVFSTGGYTGNVYHEFNDGIIPLYITSQYFNKKVVFVILEYHNWWYTKYGAILSQLTEYPLININADSRTHCFKEAIVGLKIHDELTVDSSFMERNNTSILDFRSLLGRALEPSVPSSYRSPKAKEYRSKRPKLVLLSRKGSRSITNEHLLVKLAQKVGFEVEVLKPNRNTDLASIYKVLSTSDVMIGVHGAAMTHLLFLTPGSVLIQVIPLGTDWSSETYYGEPAKKMGLKYIGYNIHPRESSLYHKYGTNDPILRDPDSVNKKGWEYTKRIYLDDQIVTLDLNRFRKVLVRAHRDYNSF